MVWWCCIGVGVGADDCDLNRDRSCSEAVFPGGEVGVALGDFGDLLGLLVGGELSAEGAGEFGAEEEGAFVGGLVEVAGGTGSLLLIKNGKIPGDVLPDSPNLGKFGGAAGGGLGVPEISEFLLEFVDVGTDGLDIAFPDLFVDLLFHHSDYQ